MYGLIKQLVQNQVKQLTNDDDDDDDKEGGKK
jgi:hypothetical protein